MYLGELVSVIYPLTPALSEGFQSRRAVVRNYYCLICSGNMKLHDFCLEGYFEDLFANLQGKCWIHARFIYKGTDYFECFWFFFPPKTDTPSYGQTSL